jgi:hypothetical protein
VHRTRSRSWRNGAACRRPAPRRRRPAPAIDVRILHSRTRPVVPPRCPARRGGSRRPVKAVRARRHPAPVRQPVLPTWHRPALGRPAIERPAIERPALGRASPGHGAAVRGAAVGHAALRWAAVRGAAVGPGTARRKPARLAWGRGSRLAEPLLPGRHFARPAKQLSVVVFLDVYRSARSGRIILLVLGGGVAFIGGIGSRAVAAAIPLAPGRTVRVAAEAGVATFHQIPPGLWCPAAPRDICPYLSSVGRQKSPA